MSKILFIGDPHLKITRFELAKKFLTWLNSTISSIKPDLVVNLGDTFDTHAVIRSEVMSEFLAHVKFVNKLNIPYVYLLGNHDMYKPNDAKYHALLPFKGTIESFYVIDEITELEEFPGITWVPYQHDPNNFPTKTQELCVAHQTFKDADYGDIVAKDGVDAESVESSLIISGHIHKRQSLKSKVIYPGSPFSQSANDVNEVKGLLLFDTDTLHQSFIACPLPMWRGDRFELGPSFSVDNMHEYIASNLPGSQDHWVLEMVGPKAEIMGYLGSKEYKQVVNGVDVKIKTSFTDKEKRQVKIEALSMEHIVSEYVAKIYSGSLDKVELQEKALEVLSTARKR